MSDKKEARPLGELSAYERWELPTLKDPNAPTRSRSAVVNKPIKPLTAEDIEKIHLEAYNAGFEEGKAAGHESGRQAGVEVGKQTGHQDGLQQGISAGQAQINQQIEQLKKLMAQLVDPINEQRTQVEKSTLNVALALARTVIHRELKLDSSSIETALVNIYQSLPKMDQGLVLTINPKDKDNLERVLESIESNIELKQDPNIMVGGCLLETSNQLIDYTIEKRFQKVVHEMLLNAIELESDIASLDTSTTIKELSDYPVDLLDKADELAVETTDKQPGQDVVQNENRGEIPDAGVLQEAVADVVDPEVEASEENTLSEPNALPEQESEAEQNKTDNQND